MSYSFSVTAANKAEAKTAVAAKFEEVVTAQPIHARDREAALANANAVIDLLNDDDTKHVTVNLNGYVGWLDMLTAAADNPLRSASVSANATLIEPAAS